mmetsp:Transcript_13269/g.27085  ORF Transcript_13269/g.27085 Transcript_13269/m.27085 type:complete len:1231 (+) Transcript_13269:234-3926(+)
MTNISLSPDYLLPVIKGKSDYRSYRPLILPYPLDDEGKVKDGGNGERNGLTVILIQDQNSKHFAAAVSVASGASADPRALPGIAHFCEHMCFLGSEAYPKENEYKQYLSQHGGKSNASTSASHTTYQFDVLADYGQKALDIFSNFFIAPLFTMSGTEREVHAVDSENSKNLINDGRRRWQILKDLADKNHHFSKFSTGNKKTLPAAAVDSGDDSSPHRKEEGNSRLDGILWSINDGEYDEHDKATFVRAVLLAFHKRHYRPTNMTVVVVGPQTLDELESWVVPRFGRIPDRWLEKNEGTVEGATEEAAVEKWAKMQKAAAKLVNEAANDAPPVSINAEKKPSFCPSFRPQLQGGKWPILVTVLPLKSTRTLVLYFPLPPTWHVPDQSPTRILSHLFGHEGPGSVFALLQDAGLITSLSAGNRVSAPDQNLFQIQMSLTADGEENWKEVVRVLFSYGRLIRDYAKKSMSSHPGQAEDTTRAEYANLDPLRRIWDEVATLDRMRFDQTSPGHVYSFAPALAQSASKYGTTHCLSAGSLLNENGTTLPLQELMDFCEKIIPENCFVERCSKGAWAEAEASFKGNDPTKSNQFCFGKQTEKWYQVDYYVSPIDDEAVRGWNGDVDVECPYALHLPEPNRYIPRSLELCPDLPEDAKKGPRIEKPIEPPKLIVNNHATGRLWWRLDDRYALPKATLKFLIRTAKVEHRSTTGLQWEYDALTAMRSNFVTGIFADSLAQETYDADLAGLGWSLSKSSSGYTLSCHGYSDRLSHLALKLLSDFCSDSFIKETHFSSNQDKIVRGLESYFESRRADSLAVYYRDLLLTSRSGGVEENLEYAKGLSMKDIVDHHRSVWTDEGMFVECLYSGNVSSEEAKDFFEQAMGIIGTARSHLCEKSSQFRGWVPGPFERRLPTGEDFELHFQSKNAKEENGAVLVTYQSQTEGFKGKSLSSQESMRLSATIRLISTIMREPFFNELRTKQQLGYIVSSYYDLNFSSKQFSIPTDEVFPSTTPIDSIVLYVLSRNTKPTEVINRIDDFLMNFRSRIADMTSYEIQSFADSLADQLTKPIRKLGDEAGGHFSKIRRFAPEVVVDGSEIELEKLPWDNADVLAKCVRTLSREDILNVWDSLVLKTESRSRIVSYVYGNTFPMDIPLKIRSSNDVTGKVVNISTKEELLIKRRSLIPYEPNDKRGIFVRAVWEKHRTRVRYAAAAAAVVGVGLWGLTMMKRDQPKKKTN